MPNMQTTARWGVVDPSGARPARQHCRCRCQRPRAHGSRLCAHREGCEERLSLYLLEPPTAPSGGRPASDDSCELRGARSAPNEAGSPAGWELSAAPRVGPALDVGDCGDFAAGSELGGFGVEVAGRAAQ